ncbi:hypothetical protein [Vibrio fluvialis]|uniref:hypothetical protein n=1 Tax=Vibrio fluvialis TaxID=676 RepID=UPI00399B74DA
MSTKSIFQALESIPTVCACRLDDATNTIGVSFDYLGVIYTAYIDVDTQAGELLRHDKENLTLVENIGAVTASDLISFFSHLPPISSILK